MVTKIKIKLTPQNVTYEISVEDLSMTVREAKELIEKESSIPQEEQRLVYRGRVLKDSATLTSHGQEDGHTIQLVRGAVLGMKNSSTKKAPVTPNNTETSESIKTNANTSSSNKESNSPNDIAETNNTTTPTVTNNSVTTTGAETQTPHTTPIPSTLGQNTQANPFASLFAAGAGGGANTSTVSNNTQANPFGRLNPQQMMSTNQNPAQMWEFMRNDPLFSQMVEQILTDSNFLDMIVNSSPEQKATVEQNPELRRMFQDPQMLRTYIETARNPALMREQMAQNERAMANIQSMPGGYQALASVFNNVLSPQEDAVRDTVTRETTSTGTSTIDNIDTKNTDAPNSAPIPNPWAQSTNNSSNSAGDLHASSNTNTADDPFSSMLRMMTTQHQQVPSQQQQNATSSGNSTTTGGGSITDTATSNQTNTGGGIPGMNVTNPLQNGANPFSNISPQYARNQQNDPLYQQVLESMFEKPEVLSSIQRLSMDPDTARQASETFANNPELVKSTLNMQRSSQFDHVLNANNAGGATNANGAPSSNADGTPNVAATAAATAFMNSLLNSAGTNNIGINNNAGQNAENGSSSLPVSRQADLAGATQRARENAAVMYRQQIAQMVDMGFTDTEEVLSALIYTGGNIEAAITRLFRD